MHDVSKAVVVLNAYQHRGSAGWAVAKRSDGPIVVITGGGTHELTEFEALAIADRYLATPPKARVDHAPHTLSLSR
jgi:hypothetical protein